MKRNNTVITEYSGRTELHPQLRKSTIGKAEPTDETEPTGETELIWVRRSLHMRRSLQVRRSLYGRDISTGATEHTIWDWVEHVKRSRRFARDQLFIFVNFYEAFSYDFLLRCGNTVAEIAHEIYYFS